MAASDARRMLMRSISAAVTKATLTASALRHDSLEGLLALLRRSSAFESSRPTRQAASDRESPPPRRPARRAARGRPRRRRRPAKLPGVAIALQAESRDRRASWLSPIGDMACARQRRKKRTCAREHGAMKARRSRPWQRKVDRARASRECFKRSQRQFSMSFDADVQNRFELLRRATRRLEEVGAQLARRGKAEPRGGDLEAPADHPGIGARRPSCARRRPSRKACRRASNAPATARGAPCRENARRAIR